MKILRRSSAGILLKKKSSAGRWGNIGDWMSMLSAGMQRVKMLCRRTFQWKMGLQIQSKILMENKKKTKLIWGYCMLFSSWQLLFWIWKRNTCIWNLTSDHCSGKNCQWLAEKWTIKRKKKRKENWKDPMKHYLQALRFEIEKLSTKLILELFQEKVISLKCCCLFHRPPWAVVRPWCLMALCRSDAPCVCAFFF